MTTRIFTAIAIAMLFIGFPKFDDLMAEPAPASWAEIKAYDPAAKPVATQKWTEVFSITINGTELPAGGHETNLRGLSVSHFNGQPFLVIMGVPARFMSRDWTGSPSQIDLLGNGLEERYYGRLTMWVGELSMGEPNTRRRGH